MGRKQKVVLNNHKSEWSSVHSGVPQGSVLGPSLLNIYVSDISSIVNSPIFQFADDVKMLKLLGLLRTFTQCKYAFCLVQEMAIEVQY